MNGSGSARVSGPSPTSNGACGYGISKVTQLATLCGNE